MQIRKATKKDVEVIFNIANLAFKNNPLSFLKIAEQLSTDSVEFFLFESEGFVSLKNTADFSDVLDIAVIPEFQNKGIGSKLLQFIGNKNLILEVRKSNLNAIELYKKAGFKIISTRKNYYSNPIEDALIMERKKNITILAFESSADETSVAVVKNGNEVLANVVATQINSHQRFGGIVPEVASRHHLEWINTVLDEALKKANITDPAKQIDAVAATFGPGLVGSLLVGLMAGKTFAQIYDLPFIGVNHLSGHISAANFNMPIEYPALSLMVSGGHTELVLMEKENDFQIIGETLDDAAGEAFDKIGRVMGLKYPAGKEIQELAKLGENNIDFPIAHTEGEMDFSFSGLKSAVINYLYKAEQQKTEINKNDVLASFQSAVVNALIQKTKIAVSEYDVKQIILAGGVAANQLLRTEIEKLATEYNLNFNLVPLNYTGDNAAMIGAAAYLEYKSGNFSDLSLDTKPNLDFHLI